MAIITISRGTFAGGAMLAERLAKKLDYRLASREDLFQRVGETYGVGLAQIAMAMDRTPNLFDPVARRSRRLLSTVQATLCELVADDRVVYHGQVGHLLLPGVSHVLRLRLIAPRKMRIALAMRRESMTEVEAGRRIDQVDSERARWTQFFYGVASDDPNLFDITLNLDCISLDDAVDTVAHITELPGFQATARSVQRLHDLRLAAQVKALLLIDDRTGHIDVDVQSDAGNVRLASPMTETDLAMVQKVVGALPGLVKVEAARVVWTR